MFLSGFSLSLREQLAAVTKVISPLMMSFLETENVHQLATATLKLICAAGKIPTPTTLIGYEVLVLPY